MSNQSNKIIDNSLTKLLNKSYDYGFSTNIEKDIIKKGLNEKTVNLISLKKNEPCSEWHSAAVSNNAQLQCTDLLLFV